MIKKKRKMLGLRSRSRRRCTGSGLEDEEEVERRQQQRPRTRSRSGSRTDQSQVGMDGSLILDGRWKLMPEYSFTNVSQGPRGQSAVGRVDFRLLFPDGNPSGGNSSGGVGE